MKKELLKKILRNEICVNCLFKLYWDYNICDEHSEKKRLIYYYCGKKIFEPKYNTCKHYYNINKRPQVLYMPLRPKLIAILYSATKLFQKILHFIGIAWHDTLFDECTKDFNCCCLGIGRFHFNKSKRR